MSIKLKTTHINKSISKLYLNAELSDFAFKFESEKVPVHKCILANVSPVFRAMFSGPIKEKGDSVEIIDSNAEAFKEFLQFFYLDEAMLTKEHIQQVRLISLSYFLLTNVGFSVNSRLRISPINTI